MEVLSIRTKGKLWTRPWLNSAWYSSSNRSFRISALQPPWVLSPHSPWQFQTLRRPCTAAKCLQCKTASFHSLLGSPLKQGLISCVPLLQPFPARSIKQHTGATSNAAHLPSI